MQYPVRGFIVILSHWAAKLMSRKQLFFLHFAIKEKSSQTSSNSLVFFMPSQVYLILVQNIEICSTLYMISIVQYYKLID